MADRLTECIGLRYIVAMQFRPPLCIVGIVVSATLVACGEQAAPDVPPLYPGQPDLLAISDDFQLREILGDVPPPRFARLEYEQEIETAARTAPEPQYEQTITLVESRGSMAVLDITFEFADAALGASERQLGVGDLLTLMRTTTQPRRSGPALVTRMHVELIDESTGRLFPLAAGNRLLFTLVSKLQTESGPKQRSLPQTLDFAHEFEVVRRLPPAVYNSVSIDGPVWVIRHIETDPQGARTERELHFSEQLGMPVYDEETRGSVTTRRYLVAWERADGQRVKQRTQ